LHLVTVKNPCKLKECLDGGDPIESLLACSAGLDMLIPTRSECTTEAPTKPLRPKNVDRVEQDHRRKRRVLMTHPRFDHAVAGQGASSASTLPLHARKASESGKTRLEVPMETLNTPSGITQPLEPVS